MAVINPCPVQPVAAPPARLVHVRQQDREAKPWESGYYLPTTGGWSPLLSFDTAAEATVYAAAVNRRSGRWAA